MCPKGVRVDQAVRYLGRLRALRFECDNYNAATRAADAQHFGRKLELWSDVALGFWQIANYSEPQALLGILLLLWQGPELNLQVTKSCTM